MEMERSFSTTGRIYLSTHDERIVVHFSENLKYECLRYGIIYFVEIVLRGWHD